MTEKENKSIEELENLSEYGLCYTITSDIQENIRVALNLIQKQQAEKQCLKQAGEATEKVYKAELEKKDKIIDEMAEVICRLDTMNNYDTWENNIEDVKQYFERKVEGK